MRAKSASDKNSVFIGVAFILIAAIVGVGGILWKNFVEYTSNSSGLPDVFSGITSRPPYDPTVNPDERDQIIFTFTIPRGDLVKFLEIMQPHLDEIVKKTGKTAHIDISTNELEVVSKVERRIADFGSISTMGYLLLRKNKPITAVLERFSDPPKRSIFVVKKDDPASSLADLRGYRIAYRSNDSLPGYMIPTRELKKLGYEHSTFFKQEFFSENFSDSILGLQNDQYDCIVLASNFFLEQSESVRKTMKIIHESRPVPGGVYFVNSHHRSSYEQILVGNFIKYLPKVSDSEMFSGMFKVKQPDETSFELLEKEYGGEP